MTDRLDEDLQRLSLVQDIRRHLQSLVELERGGLPNVYHALVLTVSTAELAARLRADFTPEEQRRLFFRWPGQERPAQ